MITSHPTDARYYASRRAARESSAKGERVIRLGYFQGGSFGVYPPITENGRYVGQLVGPGGYGPIPSVCVWMVTARAK